MLKGLILWALFVFFCYLAFTAFDMGEMTIALIMLGIAVVVGLAIAASGKKNAREAEPARRRR